MFFVYILECSDGTFYTGYTNDIEKRLEKHNSGKASRYTRSRRPLKLAWKKRAKTRSGAMREEILIKRFSRADKEKLVSGARFAAIAGKYR